MFTMSFGLLINACFNCLFVEQSGTKRYSGKRDRCIHKAQTSRL